MSAKFSSYPNTTLNVLADTVSSLFVFSNDTFEERLSKISQLYLAQTDLETLSSQLLVSIEPVRHWWNRRGVPRARAEQESVPYIISKLLTLETELWLLHGNALPWFQQRGALQNPDRSFSAAKGAIRRFERSLAEGQVRLSTTTYEVIAIALRGFADTLSIEATTTATGWLDSANDISRELRFTYNKYRTKRLWASTGSAWSRWIRHPARSVVALLSTLYGLVAGYGLRSGRFAGIALSVIVLFSAIFWWIGFNHSMTLSAIGSSVILSLGAFTTFGSLGMINVHINLVLQELAALESLIGYLMLGVLISVFWTASHESGQRVSGIRGLSRFTGKRE